MNPSHLVACGLLMALLSVCTEAKPLTQAQQKPLRALLGEELSEFLASGERERRLENRARLLRELTMDTRAKIMWARKMNDQPNSRRNKSGNKKAGSTPRSGCFGYKIDRIGTMSGMGCHPANYPAAGLSW
ncbi:C-type natriuretic peptide [Chanos chanos]|uniref:C-type natriuretic peptide n=1 Tax=Chanos chanos TaxID=29144 RepID=A0A6J2WQ86_CHACN|nr:C-type natriuretic peptide [Chanos chanos]